MTWLALILAGVFAGTVNTMAGGGSLIGIPALIFAGLGADEANATNRIGVLIQSIVAVARFRRAGLGESRLTAALVLPCCLGATAGAWLSTGLDEALLRRVIGGVLLLMLGLLLLRPRRWLEGRPDQPGGGEPTRLDPLRWLAFVAIGLYGGFVQAGVGVVMLAALVLLLGRDLLRANAIKVALVGVFTVPALGIYAREGLLVWPAGLALAAGSAIGAWLGTHLAVSWGPALIRGVLTVVIIASSLRLLGVV